MKVKWFVLKDQATEMKVMGIHLEDAASDDEKAFLRRVGYGEPLDDYVIMATLDAGHGEITSDPHRWRGDRTMKIAHLHLQAHPEVFEQDDAVIMLDVRELPEFKDVVR